MQKEYKFRFQGTKEMFLNPLGKTSENNCKLFYLEDYIVQISGDKILFGVERMGHSGGNWYVAEISELEECLEFAGTIEYIGPEYDKNESKFKKITYKIIEGIFFILCLPIVLIIWIAMFIVRCIKKMFKHNSSKPKNTEEKLYDLMENHLNCIRM